VIAVRRLAEGEVVREAIFSSEGPLVLGRGPEADFPVLEDTVSRVHARLTRDEAGAWWLEDAGSRNGLVMDGRRVERARVDGTLRCHLGAAEIEVALASGESTLEWQLEEAQARQGSAARAFGYWAAGVAATVARGLLSPGFWSPWEKERLTGAVQLALSAGVGLPVMAFVLVGLLRVARRRARLTETLRALAVVLGIGLGVGVLSALLPYLARPDLQSYLSIALQLPAAVFTVAFLASVARPGPRRRFFLGWAGAATLLALAFLAVGGMASRRAGLPAVRYDLSVPVAGFSGPAGDLSGYLDAVRRDFKDAQREAAAEDQRTRSAPVSSP